MSKEDNFGVDEKTDVPSKDEVSRVLKNKENKQDFVKKTKINKFKNTQKNLSKKQKEPKKIEHLQLIIILSVIALLVGVFTYLGFATNIFQGEFFDNFFSLSAHKINRLDKTIWGYDMHGVKIDLDEEETNLILNMTLKCSGEKTQLESEIRDEEENECNGEKNILKDEINELEEDLDSLQTKYDTCQSDLDTCEAAASSSSE